MIAGQAVMLATAVVAARDAARPGLLWVAALPFYWPLGAVAAWRAMAEIFTRPSFWHKTEHGVSEQHLRVHRPRARARPLGIGPQPGLSGGDGRGSRPRSAPSRASMARTIASCSSIACPPRPSAASEVVATSAIVRCTISSCWIR